MVIIITRMLIVINVRTLAICLLFCLLNLLLVVQQYAIINKYIVRLTVGNKLVAVKRI